MAHIPVGHTAGDLRSSTVTEKYRDPVTGTEKTFNRPNVFATWGNSKHAVDDNNNTRQRMMNLLAGWPTQNAIKRHLLLPFAISEANALHCWNFFRPDERHTKKSWRRNLGKQLLTHRHEARVRWRLHPPRALCLLPPSAGQALGE